MILTAEEIVIFRAIISPENSSLDAISLARLAGLNPKNCFVGGCWAGVDFGEHDLCGFDFRRSDLREAIFSRVRGLSSIIIDKHTILPQKFERLKTISTANEFLYSASSDNQRGLRHRSAAFAAKAAEAFARAGHLDGQIRSMIIRSEIFVSAKAFGSARQQLLDLVALCLKQDHQIGSAKAYTALGDINRNLYELQLADEHYNLAAKFATEAESKSELSIILIKKALLLETQGCYNQANEILIDLLPFELITNDNLQTRAAYECLGNVCAKLGQWERAEQYFHAAIKFLGSKDKNQRASISYKRAMALYKIGEIERALFLLYESLELSEKIQESSLYIQISDEIINIYKTDSIKSNTKILENSYQNRISFLRSLPYQLDTSLSERIGRDNLYMGMSRIHMGDYSSSNEYLITACIIYNNIWKTSLVIRCKTLMAKNYLLLEQKERALSLANEAIVLSKQLIWNIETQYCEKLKEQIILSAEGSNLHND